MNKSSDWFKQLQVKRQNLANHLKDPAAAGLWKSVIDKYSENAHFIYELLQNSDDTNASQVTVYFSSHSIEYIHNGTIAFSLSDPELEGTQDKTQLGHINAITSIGSSNKETSISIGRFGVGFKSVFKYCQCPHIEDDHYSFDLVDYIVPIQSNRCCSHRRKGETAFYLPIDEPQQNIPLIKERFLSLHSPLLFLSHLCHISIYEDDQLLASYDKTILQNRQDDFVQSTFLQLTTKTNTPRFYYLINKSVPTISHPIACAFEANENGSLIEQSTEEPLFCFFPTKENFFSQAILNAPFALTENRQNLMSDTEGVAWNNPLFNELGILLVQGFQILATFSDKSNHDIIDTNIDTLVIQTLQKTKSNIHVLDYEKKFTEGVLSGLYHSKVFYTDSHQYVKGKHAMLPMETSMIELFPVETIHRLMPDTQICEWVSKRFPVEIANFQPWKSLGFIQKVITFELLLQSLDATFLQEQSIEWFRQFYHFLLSHRSFWNSPAAKPVLSNVPLFLCEDGMCRTLYSTENDVYPTIYLSGGCENSYLNISSELLKDSKCKHFFEIVGMKEPGALAEICERIIPAYQNGTIDLYDEQLNKTHVRFFVSYYRQYPPFSEERTQFIKMLQTVPFLKTFNNEGRSSFQEGKNCYFASTLIKDYLRHDTTVYFVENSWIEEIFLPEERDVAYDFFESLGVRYGLSIREVERISNVNTLKCLNLHPVSLRQSDNGGQRIIDKEIEGATTLLQHCTIESSLAFYRLLQLEIQKQTSYLFRLSLEGIYRYYEKGKRIATEETIYHTTAKQTIFESPWLLGRDGTWHSVSEIKETSQLSTRYDFSAKDLLFFLGIKLSDETVSLTKEQQEALDFVSYYESKGVTISDMKQILDDFLKHKN